MKPSRHLAAGLLAASLLAAGCSSDGSATSAQIDDDEAAAAPVGDAAGIRLVNAQEGADILANPPDDLVVLDVRTPAEFAEGHIEGAMMIDFNGPDFADQVAELDPDAPYLLYCRSGNRSGQAASIMDELGFADVADVDGGILAWGEDGHEVVVP